MLEYRLVEAGPAAVEVRHAARDGASGIALVLAIAAGGAVAWPVLRAGGSVTDSPVLIVLAFFALFASMMTVIRAHWREGHLLRFDATTGHAGLRDDARGDTTAWPLAQFAAVETRTTRSSSSGSGSTTWYHAELRLHDGALLPVLRTRSERQRDEVAAALRTIVAGAQGEAPATPAPGVPQAPFTSRCDRGDIVVAWRTTVKVRSFASLAVALVSLLTLVGSLMRATLAMGGAYDWFPVLFLAIWLVLPGGALVLAILHQLRTHQRRHELRIGDRAVRYTSRGSVVPAHDDWMLPLDALAAVRLRWGTGQLELVTRGPVPSAHGSRLHGDAGAAPAIEADRPPLTIDVGRLPLGQVVAFEQWLQAELAMRAGRAVA